MSEQYSSEFKFSSPDELEDNDRTLAHEVEALQSIPKTGDPVPLIDGAVTSVVDNGVRNYPKGEDGRIIINPRDEKPQDEVGGFNPPSDQDRAAARKVYAGRRGTSVIPMSDHAKARASEIRDQLQKSNGRTALQERERIARQARDFHAAPGRPY